MSISEGLGAADMLERIGSAVVSNETIASRIAEGIETAGVTNGDEHTGYHAQYNDENTICGMLQERLPTPDIMPQPDVAPQADIVPGAIAQFDMSLKT